MLNTISIFVFRKKYHRISDIRLDTLKSTRYGYPDRALTANEICISGIDWNQLQRVPVFNRERR